MKKNKLMTAFLFVGLLIPFLSGCSTSVNNALTIRVLNSEDYIYLNDPENGYDEDDLIDQFADYIAHDPELFAKYGKIQIVYDTADTMENIYSEMQTGKTQYDLICASDYIVAKMARYGLIKPIDKTLVPNYFGIPEEGISAKATYSLTSRLDNIKTTPVSGDYIGQEQNLGDYAVGYMWGTLGLLFNPEYKTYEKRGIDFDTIIEDMSDYSALWDDKYNNTISIKDSMRDTFAFGLMQAYKDSYADKNGNQHDGFEILRKRFYEEQGSEYDLYTPEQYNAEFSEIFNYVINENANPQQVVDDVVEQLNSLKKNIFGLEVDSGKQDIVTGKIGINMAWSGDAVYAMDQAEDPEQVSNPHELYYSVPKTGSNIWMDVWVAPKLPENKQSQLQWELAHEFLNYLCDPEIAAKNMDYTGYTSFIAGDEIVDLVRDWYDIRTEEVYYIDDEDNYFDVYAVEPTIEEITADILNDDSQAKLLDYDDLLSTSHDTTLDDFKLYYVEAEYDDESGNITDLISYDIYPLEDEEEKAKTYGELTIVDNDEEIEKVNLTYFFENTLNEYGEDDMYFYTDCYSVYIIDGTEEICVGRQFYTQFPDEMTLVRCAVMQDYARGNEDFNPLIMKMWENFKSDPLPVWAIVLFVLIVLALIGGFSYLFLSKYFNKKLRKKRKLEQK